MSLLHLYNYTNSYKADSSGRAVYGVGLRPLACWDWGFESRLGGWGDGCVSGECCVLSGRGLCDGLINRPEESYRVWCVSGCDRGTSQRSSRPTRVVESWKKSSIKALLLPLYLTFSYRLNPLALDIYSLAHHLYKMLIFYEPRRLTLGNTRHFVEE